MAKSVHVTLSLPKDVKDWLYNSMEKGSISQFVTESIKKSLHDIEIYPFEAQFNLAEKNCKVMLNQARALDKSRLGKKKVFVSSEILEYVDKAIKIVFGIQ